MNSIDETLMQPREIVKCEPDDSGMGFIVKLNCGHVIWFAVQPVSEQHCALCLDRLVAQVRQIQMHQEPRYDIANGKEWPER
jgi:hypothetical protein